MATVVDDSLQVKASDVGRRESFGRDGRRAVLGLRLIACGLVATPSWWFGDLLAGILP